MHTKKDTACSTLQTVLSIVNRWIFMGFRMTKTEIQCIEDLPVNEVFIEREER